MNLRRLLGCLGSVLAVFLFVWQQVQATRLGFKLEEFRRLASAKRQENAYLRVELETLTSPTELDSSARRRLGMVPPVSESLVTLGGRAERGGGMQRPMLLGRLQAAEMDAP